MAIALAKYRNIVPKVSFLLNRQFKMSAQLRAEKAMEDMKKSNPYFEKYAQKIAVIQKESPEEFLAKIDKLEAVADKKPDPSKERKYTELLNPKQSLKKPVDEIPHKKLSDIMKLELLQDKTTEEITSIWLEYHLKKNVLAAVITVEQYELLMQRGKQNPLFILPLPRSQGFEFMLLQYAANCIHFTPLLCYQVHKENAPECLNLVHYTDLKDKGVILMRGEYDIQVINAQEAQCLANELQLYYGQHNESKIKLLEKFTKDPASFNHMDVVKELENLQI